MSVIGWIAGLVLLLMCAQYVLGPILIYRSQRLPGKYQFELLDKDVFLQERGKVFRSLHDEIIGSGFRYIGSAEMKMSHSAASFSIYCNEEKRLTCTLLAMYAVSLDTTVQIELTQMYADGSLLGVNNNSLFGVYPDWDRKESFRFPDINDFPDLLAVMDRIIDLRGSGREAVPLPDGREFETIEAFLNDEISRMVALGWVSPVVVDGQRKLTIKGAALMTWKMCWPVKGILNRADMSRSLKVLRNG